MNAPMLALLALACAHRALPPPVPSAEPATSFTTDAAPLGDQDVALYQALAESLGSGRPDAACDQLAHDLLATALARGGLPTDLEVGAMAQADGMPLPLRTWFVGQDRPKWLVRRMFVELLGAGADRPTAFGFASWGRGRQTTAALVVADDLVHLAAPFPRVTRDAAPLTLAWDGPGVPIVESIGPEGRVTTELTVEDGQAHGVLPPPGSTGIRHDLVRLESHPTHDESTLLASFDQPAPDGSLPGAPALPDGDDATAAVVGALDALHPGAPLTPVQGSPGCDQWPADVGDVWVTSGQRCWSFAGVDWRTAWQTSAARPYFQRVVVADGYDLVGVDASDGLTVHLFRKFERLDPAAAADRVAALVAAKYPGATRVPTTDPAFLQAQASAMAADDNQRDEPMNAVLARDDLLGTDVSQVFVHSLAATTLEDLVELVDQDFVPTRFAVAADTGRDADGYPTHYAIVVVGR
jgi:hypothetical protein